MQKKIHPQFFPQAKAACACGNTFTVGATRPELHVEICHRCHPFYTGKQKFIDAGGQLEKFRKRLDRVKKARREGGAARARPAKAA